MRIETPEQSSKALQRAQRALVEAQDGHARALRSLQSLRRNFDASNTGLNNPDSEAGRRERARLAELRKSIDTAVKQRDAAREQLGQAKEAAAAAEREACREVGDKHRPEYMTRLRRFITAKLESIEPMVVAAAEAVEVREVVRVALGVRREHYARLPVALGLLQDHERFERMRAEVVELIDNKAVTRKDLPPKLAKLWKI